MKRKRGVFGIMAAAALLLALLAGSGCDKTVTEPKGPEMQMSAAAQDGLVSGFQTIHSLSSVGQVVQLVDGEAPVKEPEMGGINSRADLRKETAKLRKGMAEALASNHINGVLDGDSLIWFIDWTDPVSGISVRKALFYNPASGKARYYESIYRFPAQVQLAYDSTEIRADLNFTLNDTTDDKVLSLHKLSEFRDGFYVERIEADAQVTDYGPNNEVTGAILLNDVFYGQQSELAQLHQRLELNPDESGQVMERLDYRDGTFLQKTVNFYPDYTGDFSEIWRDGTQVNGTFDRLEDDNHANLTRTVVFPAGNDPVQLDQYADVTLNPADSSSSLIFKEKVQFASGQVDTSRLDVQEYYQNGLKTTHLEGWHSNGSHSDLTVTEYTEYKRIEGNFTGPQGYYTLIFATLYNDGSGDLRLEVYENEQAYLNGEPPLVIIEIHFNPDGSGDGRITEGDSNYLVKVQQNGEMVVKDDNGNRQTVKGF